MGEAHKLDFKPINSFSLKFGRLRKNMPRPLDTGNRSKASDLELGRRWLSSLQNPNAANGNGALVSSLSNWILLCNMMRALLLRKGISRALSLPSSTNSSSFRSLAAPITSSSSSLSDLLSSPLARPTAAAVDGRCHLLGSLWSVIQHRGFKVHGSDVRVGNIIERKERIYQVTKVEHSHEGRGKATIKVELRDVESGNKVTQRLATDESVDRVFVQEKAYIFMCRDRDAKVLLMDPDTYEQLEVPEELFGKAAMYLQDDMKVMVQLFNDTPLSASVPKRVTCVVKEAQPPMKGIAATPKEKKAVLDNGMTVKVPPHVIVGDVVVINTEDDSYIERAKG